MNTFDQVKALIVDALNCGDEEVTMAASLSDDLGADSLDAVELIMSLEDTFGIAVPEDSAKDMKTVGDVVALVDALK